MDTLENHLAALIATDAPPARDVAFELAVMARIERKRFRQALAENAGIAALAALVLFALAPWLGPVLEGMSANLVATLLVTLVVMAAMQWSLQRMDV